MKHYIKIYINTTSKSNLLLKINKIGVDIRNINYLKDGLMLECLSSDIKKLKRYLLSYKIEIVDEAGIYKIKSNLKKNSLTLIGLIFSIIVFLFLTNIIVKVNIIHQDQSLRELLDRALKEEGVKALSIKKSYQEYERIINKIKEEYHDKIEWLEIDVQGMVINVRVEERIVSNKEEEHDYCNIIAKKDGIVKSILNKRGSSLVNINSYVKKGDVLISGEIKVNDEVKNNVCSDGKVEAEVWYNAKVSFPLEYEEIEKTGKMRYNLVINDGLNDYQILKSRVKDKVEEKKLLLNILGYKIYLVKEYEVNRVKKTYNESEALEIIKKEILEKLNVKEEKITQVITQKVLKKSINNGNLDIEMFISVIEDIGEVEYYTLEMDSEEF